MIGRQPLRDGDDVFFGEAFGFERFAREQEPPDFGNCGAACGVVAVAFFAGPDGGLVQLDAFGGDAAKDHCAKASVADRKGFVPGRGRLPIPQHGVAVSRGRGNCEQQNRGNTAHALNVSQRGVSELCAC